MGWGGHAWAAPAGEALLLLPMLLSTMLMPPVLTDTTSPSGVQYPELLQATQTPLSRDSSTKTS